jgi:Pyruvate/2-oxoacid:ferredoxin oxidoreductase delta subunit
MRRIIGHYETRPGLRPEDPPTKFPVARDLETLPGIPTRPDEIAYFSREEPLESVAVAESASAEWASEVRRESWPEVTELYERHVQRIGPLVEWIKSVGDLEPIGTPTGEDVTDGLRAKARELGYGEVGFTKFDRRYVYQSRRADLKPGLPNAVCLALEQDYEATQTLPSLEAEEAHGATYERQGELVRELVEYIRSLGYRCQLSGPTWFLGPVIPMFVAAGLGQLGHNGQLLSPHFGSRARLQIVLTDARVTHDSPVDYGVHNFCRGCQVCVTRCPGRALSGQQLWYRGVEKAKLVFKRCRPVMARYSGCGVCMKVCPIQRYGMKPVMEHYVATGRVLGMGTDNLEGYSLPGKGYFPPGRRPSFDPEFFDMPRGRIEDQVIDRFKKRLAEDGAGGQADGRTWQKLRLDLERAVQRRDEVVDMGMDIV